MGKIRSFFTKPRSSLHTTRQVIEVLGEFEQTIEAGQVITNIAYSSDDKIDDILNLDERLFITGMVINLFSYLVKVIKYILQPNKNLTNTTNLIKHSVLLAFNILMCLGWIGVAGVSAVLLLAATSISLIADVFYNFIETIKYTYLTLTAKSREEARFFAPKIAYHAKGAALIGLICIAYTLLSFNLTGASAVAAITATTIAAVTVSSPFLMRFISFFTWLCKSEVKNEKPKAKIINPPQAIQYKKYPPLCEFSQEKNTPSTQHTYYENSIVIARPLEEIKLDIQKHIYQLSMLLKKSTFFDRQQFEKRRQKIAGLNLLISFINEMCLTESYQKTNSNEKISISLNYQEICSDKAKKQMVVLIDRVDFSHAQGRKETFLALKKEIEKNYPCLLSQFNFNNKHGYVHKLFSEVEAFISQPNLHEIKSIIEAAKKEAEEWQQASLGKKLNPFQDCIFTLRKRSPPQAFELIERVIESIESNQLEYFVRDLYPNDQNILSTNQDLFVLIERKLRSDYHVHASFDIFGEGKLASLFQQVKEYYVRYHSSKFLPI